MTKGQESALADLPHFKVLKELPRDRLLVRGGDGDYEMSAGGLLKKVVGKADTLVGKYVENVGREPRNLPDDHPDKWQWDYPRGFGAVTAQERRDEMLERLGLGDPDEPATQEETLWEV